MDAPRGKQRSEIELRGVTDGVLSTFHFIPRRQRTIGPRLFFSKKKTRAEQKSSTTHAKQMM